MTYINTTNNTILFIHYPATTECYTHSLHDALPICRGDVPSNRRAGSRPEGPALRFAAGAGVRRRRHHHAGAPGPARSEEHTSNSSHVEISYAVFCLKKKIKKKINRV